MDVPVESQPRFPSVMTLRAYVVDDERLAVQRLTRLLNATGRVEIAGAPPIRRSPSPS